MNCPVCGKPKGDERIILVCDDGVPGWKHIACWQSELEANGYKKLEPRA